MKFPRLLLVAVLVSSTGCDRVRQFTGNYMDKAVGSAPSLPDPVVEEIGDRGMEMFAVERGKVVIIEYHAPWNGQSRQLAPLLDTLASEFRGKLAVGKLDVDKYRRFADSQGVKNIPDLRIYCDGRFVEKVVGLPETGDFRKRIADHIARIPAPAAVGTVVPSGKPLATPMRKDWMPEGMSRR